MRLNSRRPALRPHARRAPASGTRVAASTRRPRHGTSPSQPASPLLTRVGRATLGTMRGADLTRVCRAGLPVPARPPPDGGYLARDVRHRRRLGPRAARRRRGRGGRRPRSSTRPPSAPRSSPSATPAASPSSTGPASPRRSPSCRRSPSSSAAPATTPRCASPSTRGPGQRRAAAARAGARRARSRRSCCSSSSSGPRSTTSAPRSCSRPTAWTTARHYLRAARRYRPHLLSEPEEKILTEKAVTGRERLVAAVLRAGHRARGRRCPTRTSRSRSTSRSRACSPPTARCAAPPPRRSPRRCSPGCARARYIFNTLLADKADRRPAAQLPDWLAAATSPTRPATSRSQALVEAVRRPLRAAAPLVPAEGEAARRRPPRRLRPHGRGQRRRGDRRLGRGARARPRQLRRLLPRPRRRRPRVLRRALHRRAGAPRQARRRVLRLHRAQRAPLRAAELHVAAPRRPHARARARPRRARLARAPARHPRAAHAADAGRDRVGVRRGARVPAGCSTQAATPDSRARAAGREHRGLDRDRLPPDRDEPVRGPRAHRAPRGGRAVRRAHRRRCGPQSQGELLGDAVEITEGYRSWWSYVPHFIGTPGYVYAYAYGQLLALSVYQRYLEEGAVVRAALPRAARRRRVASRRRSSARSWASTSPTPASGTRAWTSSRRSSRRRRRRRARRGRSSSDGAAAAGRPARPRLAPGRRGGDDPRHRAPLGGRADPAARSGSGSTRAILRRSWSPRSASSGLLGMHLEGYGCAGASAIAYGVACRSWRRATAGCARSCRCRARWRCSRSGSTAARSRRRRGCRGWPRGEAVGCFGLTEPDCGSDPVNMRTRARRDGDDWVLNGTKMWITNGGIADVAVVWAQTDDGVRGLRGPDRHAGLHDARHPPQDVPAGVHHVRARSSRTCGSPATPCCPASRACAGRCPASARRATGSPGAPSAPARACYVAALDYAQDPRAVRQADRRLPAHPAQARRHDARAAEGAAAGLAPRGPQGHRARCTRTRSASASSTTCASALDDRARGARRSSAPTASRPNIP